MTGSLIEVADLVASRFGDGAVRLATARKAVLDAVYAGNPAPV